MHFWVYHNFFVNPFYLQPNHIYGIEFDEEFLDEKGWNLIMTVEKFMKSIYSLNENSSIDEIAKEAAKFKKNIDKIYYSGLTIDQVFELVLTKLANDGVYIKKKELKPFIKLVEKHSKRKKSPYNDEAFNAKKKREDKDEPQIEMNAKSLIGCVTIFCGFLICILPFPQAKMFGASLIAEGTREVLTGFAEENDKKKKLIYQTY